MREPRDPEAQHGSDCDRRSVRSSSTARSSEDSEDSEEESRCSLSHWFFTDFVVAKEVKIKSKNLRVPELALNAVFICTVVLVKILGGVLFYRHDGVVAQPLVATSAPATNFKECSGVEGNCKYTLPNKTQLPYCWRDDAVPCEPMDVLDATQHVGGAGVFIATSILRTRQKRCTVGDTCPFGWEAEESRKAYVQAPEAMMIKLRHRFSIAHGVRAPGRPKGLLKWVTEAEPRRLRCSGFDGRSSGLARGCSDDDGYWRARYPEACGTDLGSDDGTCMTRPMGDYISLGVVLRAANISLDQPHWPDSNMTPRDVGLPLQLEISFTNLGRDFWVWPFGSHVSYTMQPRHQSFSYKDECLRYTTHWIDETHRIVSTKMGVYVFIESSGDYASFDLLNSMTQLVVCLKVMELSKTFVRKFVTKLYKRFRCTKGTAVFFEYVAREESVQEGKWFGNIRRPGFRHEDVRKLSLRARDERIQRLVAEMDDE